MIMSRKNETGRAILLFTSLVGSVTLSVSSSKPAEAAGHHNGHRLGNNGGNVRSPFVRVQNNNGDNLPVTLPERNPVHYHLAGTLPLMNRGLNNANGFMRMNQRLDLSSARDSVTLNGQLFKNSDSLSIDIGGQMQTFTSGSKVSAAEFVALKQVSAGEDQSIKLDANGVAVGGTFSLNSIANGHVSGLVIPENVTGFDNVTGNASVVSISGNLVNYGAIYGTSTVGADAATISAKNIKNQAGGIISTEPQGPQVTTQVIEPLDLILRADKNISNHGKISSSGSLTLATTYGSIENTAGTLPVTSGGVANPPLPAIGANSISAQGDVNLIAGDGNVINDGSIVSHRGNINVSSPNDTTINIAGAGGTFEALKGDINVRDHSYAGANDINVFGGDYRSNNMNLYSGTGTITGVVGDLTGKLNTVAGVAHIYSQTDTLVIGNTCITGDPTFANVGGDIIIDVDGLVSPFNEDVAILAAGNIFSTLNGNIIAHGFDVTMIAGAKLSITGTGGNNNASQNLSTATQLTPGSTVVVDFNAGTGGDVDLTGSGFFNLIDTSGDPLGNGTAGGNVTLVACQTGAVGGHVLLGPSNDILTYGTGTNGGGNINIVGGAAPVVGEVVIATGSMFTGAGSFVGKVGPPLGNSGSIAMSTAVPTNSTGGNTVTFNDKGQIIAGGDISGTFGGVGVLAKVVVGGDLNTTAPGMGNGAFNATAGSKAGAISIRSGDDVTTNNLIAYGQGGLGGFFDINLGAGAGGAGGAGAPVTITSLNGDITINGSINTSGGGGGGGGGGSVSGFGPTTGGAGGLGGKAGAVLLDAQGLVSVNGTILAADGGAGGAGGNATGGNGGGGGGGGSFGGGGGGGGGNSATGPGPGSTSDNGGGGGSGTFGGAGGQFVGGGGGGTQIGGFQGGGFTGPPAADGSAGAGGKGSSGALGGTLFQGGQGGFGKSGGTNGIAGSAVDLLSGGGDITINGNGFVFNGQIVGKNVAVTAKVGGGAGVTAIADITGTQSVTINSDASIATQPGVTIAGAKVILSAANGSIGTNSANAVVLRTADLTVNASVDVFLQNTGSVILNASTAGNAKTFELIESADSNGNGQITLNGNVKAAAGTLAKINLQSTETGAGTGGIARTAGTLTASQIVLADGPTGKGTGDIGTNANPLFTATGDLGANTKGGVSIINSGGLTLESSSAGTNGFSLTNDNFVVTAGDTTTTGVLTLNLPLLNVSLGDTLKGQVVLINGPFGQDLTIVNAGDITAVASVNITSTQNAGGGNVIISGGGNMTSGTNTSITAANAQGAATFIEFKGNQQFFGPLTLNASDTNQSVIVDNGVTATGNNAVFVNSPLLNLIGTGKLIGNPLIFNAAGTIANSTGPIDLSTFGPIVFNGQTLAILSAGDITDGGANVTIDLSSAGADGGSLTLIAGFDFTPGTVGTVGPDNTLYTLGAVSTGNIDLGNTTITTTGAKSGGSVFAYTTGSILLNTINTAGNTGKSGSVSLHGNGVTVNGNIDVSNPTPANRGNVDIFSTTVTTVGTVTVQGGFVTGGSFKDASPTGDINLSGITGANTVTLSTGGVGGIFSSGGLFSDVLIATAGSGGIGTSKTALNTTASKLTLFAGTTGDVNVNATFNGLVDIVGVNGGNKYIIQATKDLNVSSLPTANDLELRANNSINFVPSVVSAVAAGNGDGGSIAIDTPTLTWNTFGTTSLQFNADGTGTGKGGNISVSTGVATIGNQAGEIELSAKSGATGGDGGSVFFNTSGALTINKNGISVGPQGTNGKGGSIDLHGGSVIVPGGSNTILDASGKGTGDGGFVQVIDSSANAFSIGTNVGDITLIANSGATGGNGGKVAFRTKGDLTVNAGGLSVNPLGATGDGGFIDLRANKIINAAGNLKLDVSGVGTGNGGGVNLDTVGALSIGTGATDISVFAKSGATGGNGGSLDATSAGALSVDVAAIVLGPQGANGDGGSISLDGGSITWTTVATAALDLNVDGKGTGDGGSLFVQTQGATLNIGAKAGEIKLSAQSGLNGGDGGGAVVNAPVGTVNIDGAGILVGPRGTDGIGGSFAVVADKIIFNGALALNVSGVGTGSGGVVSLIQTSKTDLTIGNGAGQVSIVANSGKSGGNGGVILLTTGGNLIIDPAALSANPVGKTGNGGTLVLTSTGGNLSISDTLSANGKGKTGAGGTIVLSSNSANVFDVGSNASGNGIAGGISVKGKGGGNIFISNNGGDVSLSTKLKQFTQLNVTSTKGSILVGSKIGDKSTVNVKLSTIAGGDITSTSKSGSVTAQSIDITSTKGIGTATAPLFTATNDIDLIAGGVVNINNKAKGVLVLSGNNKGGALTVVTSTYINTDTDLISDTSINLTASGSSGIATLAPSVIRAPQIVLNAGKAGLGTNALPVQIDGFTPGAQRTLTANTKGTAFFNSNGTGDISLAGSTAGDTFSLITGGKVTVIGTVATTKADVLITAIGAITQGAGGLINGSTVVLNSGANIGALGNELVTNAATLDTNAVGAVFIDNTANTKTTILNVLDGTSLTITTGGATTLNDLTASDGSISVIAASGLLQTSVGSTIDATAVGAGSILLQNNDIAKGKIVIGANSTITTNTGSGGDIDISIGAKAAGVAGTTPANVTVNKQGVTGGVFFSTNGITADAPTNTLNFKNANIIFTNPLAASAIRLGGGVTMTADPPYVAALVGADSTITDSNFASQQAVTAPQTSALNFSELKSGANIVPLRSDLNFSELKSGTNIVPLQSDLNFSELKPGMNIVPLQSDLNFSEVKSGINLSALLTGVNLEEVKSGLVLSSANQASAWISETELESGMIPATVLEGGEFGIESDMSAPVELQEIKGSLETSSAQGSTTSLKRMSLKRGSIVCAPSEDTSVSTPFGTVEVNAKAVVLIMAYEKGLTVYNLDDHHRNSVKLKSGQHEMTLSPGRHISVAAGSTRSFGDINPAQLFGYGSFSEHQIGNGMKAFASEFSVPQALKTVLPLKQMVTSSNPKTRKVIDHLLKTTAIMMHVSGGNIRYEQVIRPSTVAWGQ